MSKIKRTDDERLAALNAEMARLAAVAKKLEAAKRDKDARLAQRRAFLIGEAVLAQPSIPDPVRTYLAGILDQHAKRPADRSALADFLAATPLDHADVEPSSEAEKRQAAA